MRLHQLAALLPILLSTAVRAGAEEPTHIDLVLEGRPVEHVSELRLHVFSPWNGDWPEGSVDLESVPSQPRRALARLTLLGLADGTPVTLVVCDRAGFVFGSTPWTWRETGTDEPLVLELERTAALRLECEDPRFVSGRAAWDRVPPLRLDVRLVDVPGELPALAWRERSLRWLPPGAHVARVLSRGWSDQEAAVRLVAGATTCLRVESRPVPGARSVHGRLRSASGGRLPFLRITVTLVDDPYRAWTATTFSGCLGYEDYGVEADGSFLFSDVPPGPLAVRVDDGRAEVRFRDEPAGAVGLDVLVHDVHRPSGFGFDLDHSDFGPTDGGPMLATRLVAQGQEPGDGWGPAGEVVGLGDPRQRRFEWAFSARSFAPVYGTQDDFPESTGGDRILPVRLERGWGTRVVVRDRNGAPLAGASVLLDGEVAGRTDAQGSLELRRRFPPRCVEAQLVPTGRRYRPREASVGPRAVLAPWRVVLVD